MEVCRSVSFVLVQCKQAIRKNKGPTSSGTVVQLNLFEPKQVVLIKLTSSVLHRLTDASFNAKYICEHLEAAEVVFLMSASIVELIHGVSPFEWFD